MVQRRKIPEGFLFARIVPQILAFAYDHIRWLVYVIRPAWSDGLNAVFEDRAKHEGMGSANSPNWTGNPTKATSKKTAAPSPWPISATDASGPRVGGRAGVNGLGDASYLSFFRWGANDVRLTTRRGRNGPGS